MRILPAALFLALTLQSPALLLAHQCATDTQKQPLATDKKEHAARPELPRLFAHISPWLETLPDEKRELALRELTNTTPKILEIQNLIRQKMTELRSLRYDRHSSPETLPRLGRELLTLRDQLKNELSALRLRLAKELGSCPDLLPHRGLHHCR